MIERIKNYVLPTWARLLAYALMVAVVFCLGDMQGERRAGQAHVDYVTKQAAQTVAIGRAQTRVVIQTEIKYRDRIQKIYLKGEVIEKQVPIYVTQADDAVYGVNAGFVRAYNAAWSGDDPGPAGDADRGPAGIPLSAVADVDAHNATSCRAWRETALGLREFYERLKKETNHPANRAIH
jgi:hypothetical protein